MRYFEWFIARKYFWAQRRTLSTGLIALFSAAGVMVGTWLLIFVLSAINGFEQEVKRQLIGKDAHIEVTQYQFRPVANYDSLVDFVRPYPRVTAAAPFIMSKTIISRKKQQDGIVVYGVDSAASRDVIGLSHTVTRGKLLLRAGRRFHRQVLSGHRPRLRPGRPAGRLGGRPGLPGGLHRGRRTGSHRLRPQDLRLHRDRHLRVRHVPVRREPGLHLPGAAPRSSSAWKAR